MTPSDSPSCSVGLRLSLIPTVSSGLVHPGTRGPPQLTRCLSRHAIPDTPEEPRAVYVCPTSRDAGFPDEIAGRPPQFGLYEATCRFTRVTTCRFASPPEETLSGRLGSSVTTYYPAPCYGADRQLPRLAPRSQQEGRALSWALTSPTPCASSR